MPTARFAAALLIVLLAAPLASAQGSPLHDREVTWRSYDNGRTRAARARVFPSPDERRPYAVVLDDRAANGRAPITEEARYVAETVARQFGLDPEQSVFVFRYTAASFAADADDRGRAVLLRATFRRTSTGGLGAPAWRVLTPDALDELTDRGLR